MTNLAVALNGTGQHEEAESLFRKALRDLEAELGANHPHTLYCLSSLAVNLEATSGRHEEAESLLRRALQGCEATLGHSHSDTLGAANDLAVVLEHLGRYEEAEPLRLRCELGEAHPLTVSSLQRLSAQLHCAGRCSEASLLRDRAAKLQDLHAMLEMLESVGRKREADQLWKRVLDEDAPAFNTTASYDETVKTGMTGAGMTGAELAPPSPERGCCRERRLKKKHDPASPRKTSKGDVEVVLVSGGGPTATPCCRLANWI
jgi:tetratricopeptide (TPR) repeat protein